MSDRTPTLQQLLKALKKLENWFMFGVMLGVPVAQLKKIKLNHQGDVDLCKIDMFQYWLDNTLVPAWDNVAFALEGMDQLVLAAQIKEAYLWTSPNTGASNEEGATIATCTDSNNISSEANFPSAFPDESSTLYLMDVILAPIPDLPLFSLSATTNLSDDVSDQSSDEIKAEIRADVTVVSNLKELEISFGRMLVQVKRQLSKCDLSDALLFLGSVIGPDVFIGCDDFGKLMRQLQRDHIDVFNISNLQNLVANFERDESGALLDGLTNAIEAYVEKKENFLKNTTILEFQRAVVNRVKPLPTHGQAVVTIRIPEELASQQTLKDIEKLAMEGFEECHKKFIRLHAEPGSIIISWVFPKRLSSRLEQLACDNAAIFKDNGVLEVTVGEMIVFSCTRPKSNIHMGSKDVSEKKKSKLKQLYTVFYQQLIEAVSDSDSLTTKLRSASLLSHEDQAVSSSSLASDGVFLLGVEEEPHLLTVLMENMTTVEQLQTLLEDMTAWLSGSRQEQQQLAADNERLTSDKTDLLSRMHWYEEDLKTANDCMMARDTEIKEREETIKQLAKEIEELKTEIQTGRIESLLIREIEDLKSKLMKKAEELDAVIKTNSEQIEDVTNQLKIKDDKISSQEAEILHLKDTISHRQKGQSRESEEGKRNTSRLPAVYSSQAQPGYSMSSGHSHVLPSVGDSGATSEGYHSFASSLKQYTPPYSTQFSLHGQQRLEYGTELGQEARTWPRSVLSFQSAALQTTDYLSALQTVRTKQESVPTRENILQFPPSTGPTEMSPFSLPLKLEFWQRAEYAFTKFIYNLLESASKMKLNFKYENPISKHYDMSAAEALRGPALDFRWQLKHLEYNRTLFCIEVFKQKIKEPELKRWTRNLREKADKLLADKSVEQGDSVRELLDEMVQFTEAIAHCTRDKYIPGIYTHRNTLKYIYKRYLLDHHHIHWTQL